MICNSLNMIIMELIKQNHHNNLMKEFWFWRNSSGNEVDLITQDDDLLNIIEIKASSTIFPSSFKGIEYFTNLAKDDVGTKSLIYSGLENEKRTIANVISWFNIK